MKNTFVITTAILIVFAVTGLVLSAFLVDSWTKPVEDETNLTVNPTVDEMLDGKVKEYKYIEYDDSTFIKNIAEERGIEVDFDDFTITAAQAAAYGGTIMDKMCPLIEWNNLEFGISITYNGTDGSLMYHGEHSDYTEGRTTVGFYYVDANTGEVLQAYWYDEIIFNSINDEQVSDKDVFSEKLLYECILALKDKATSLGYDNIDGYVISKSFDWNGRYIKDITPVTSDGEILRMSLLNDERLNYPIVDFTNGTRWDGTNLTWLTEDNGLPYIYAKDVNEKNLKIIIDNIINE